MSFGNANTPLINYFRYKQSTTVSGNTDGTCFPITAIADGGNGQLVFTTSDTDLLSVGTAITVAATTNYNRNYSVISLTSTTINVSGTFGVSEVGTWELASNIIGSTAGEPLDFGQVFFKDNTDQITLQDTFTDRALTIPFPNPIVLDSVGSAPPIYMGTNAYFIEIFDKFNNLVATLENYLPLGSGAVPSGETHVANLFPSYGFPSQIDNGDYANNPLPIDTPNNPVSSGWFWEITTTQADANNSYRFIELGNSGLIGNPKNELILRSTNNAPSGETTNNLWAKIGDYNDFQGLQLSVSIFLQRLSGSLSTIELQLRRTKNGVNETPIDLGSITITGTRTQQQLTFSVPNLTAADYANDDQLQLLFNLPLNADFQISFTGSWNQLSPDGTVTINEQPISLDAAQQIFGDGLKILQEVPSSPNLGLPLMIDSDGTANIQQSTGNIVRGNGATNFSELMSPFPGLSLIRDTRLQQGKANRLIDYLRSNNITQSRLTFLAVKTPSVAQIIITTGIGGAPNSVWAANAGGRVTETRTKEELEFKLSAVVDNAQSNKVVFTFVDDFAPGQNPQAFDTQYSFGGGQVYISGSGGLPDPSAIVSWVGNVSHEQANQNEQAILDTYRYLFFPALKVQTLDPGSISTQAKVSITFVQNNFHMHLVDSTLMVLDVNNTNDGRVPVDNMQGLPVYRNIQGTTKRTDPSSPPVATLLSGYFSYNDTSDNPGQQPTTPIRTIRFSVDGDAGANNPIGTLSTLIVPLATGDSSNDVASKTSNAVNTSWIEQIDIVSVPQQGDSVNIAHFTQDFIIIYFDTTFPEEPANPDPSRVPIFVEFSPTDSLEDIAQTTADQINSSSAGIPYAPEIGLEDAEFLDYLITV